MRLPILVIAAAIVFGHAAPAPPALAQEATAEERLRALERHRRLIGSLRAVEALTRECYFDQSFVLLQLHGGRTEKIGTYRMLRAAADNRFLLPFRRFTARIDKLAVAEPQKALLREAMAAADAAVRSGYAMADALEADDLDAATTLFHERSLPAFRRAWRNFYTVIAELEREAGRP